MGGLGEMMTTSSSTAIEAIEGEAASVRYFNMQGIEVRPGFGQPLVKVTTFSNGRTRAEKVVE